MLPNFLPSRYAPDTLANQDNVVLIFQLQAASVFEESDAVTAIAVANIEAEVAKLEVENLDTPLKK